MKLSDLKQGDTLVGDCGYPMDKPPEWMDFDKFNRGRQFFIKHMSAIALSLHCSLVTGLSIINLLQPLVFTEKSDTPTKSFSRYFQTFLHIALWHLEDVWEAPNGKAHKSVKMVRKMHNSVAKRMNKDVKDGKLFFSQYDMALVQSGFFGGVLMYPEDFGIVCTKEDLEDYVFFWRGIGYLLGIDDKYNLCQGGYEESFDISKQIEQELLLPSLHDPPKEFDKMADAYIVGTNIPLKIKFMTRPALFAFIYEGLQLPVPRLSLLDWFRYMYLKFTVFLIRWVPLGKRFLNFQLQRMFYAELHQLQL